MDPSTKSKELNTTYIDEVALTQIAKSSVFIAKRLKEKMTERILKAKPVKITYEPQKSDLVLVKPQSKALQPTNTVIILETTVQLKNKLRYVGVWLDSNLSFPLHIEETISNCLRILSKI